MSDTDINKYKNGVLTQEILNIAVNVINEKRDPVCNIEIADYIVDSEKEILDFSNIANKLNGHLAFVNCNIHSLKFNTNNLIIRFIDCYIENAKLIDNYEQHGYISCKFGADPGIVYPKDGDAIGWKACRNMGGNKIYLVKLLIPSDAIITPGIENNYWYHPELTPSKYRCNKAKVLAVYNFFDNSICRDIKGNAVYSMFSKNRFTYKIGEWVYPDSFDDNPYVECSHGIHFFFDIAACKNFVKHILNPLFV